MSGKRVLTFDFGASGGRAILVSYEEGKLEMESLSRFPSNPVRENGFLRWDAEYFFSKIDEGVNLALPYGIDAIGIDTWGVDFGMLDENDKLICNPIHYRDEKIIGSMEKTNELIGNDALYEKTGIQTMEINTVYRFAYLKKYMAEEFARARTILMMSDLFAWHLTGEKRSELTLASTSGYINAYDRQPDKDVINALGLDESIFAPIIMPGESYGNLKSKYTDKKIPVIAVCSHDTASAVLAVPSNGDKFAYLSSGTWSLMGTELASPVISDKTKELNFTNEIGHGGTVRLLKNIVGLWQLQETKKAFERRGESVTYPQMAEWANQVSVDSYVDPDDALFMPEGDMLPRVDEYLLKTSQQACASNEERLRVIYESLALKYRLIFDKLKSITSEDYGRLYVVGGGSQDGFLAQLTANALGVKVSCGPIEATAIGNALMQFIALGAIKDAKEARGVVKYSFTPVEYEPKDYDVWQQKYDRYKEIIGGANGK